MSPPISQAFVAASKSADVCRVRCVNTELVAQVSALPGDDGRGSDPFGVLADKFKDPAC